MLQVVRFSGLYDVNDTSVASVSGNAFSVLGGGSVTVTARQEGNVAWRAAEPISQSIFINDQLPPVELAAQETLSLEENLPVGTRVGEFLATDPNGGELTYQFTSGEGDEDNSRFTLDVNGTLKSASIFDFESDSQTFSIRVQVLDDQGLSLSGSFTVNLEDVDDTPPVITLTGDGSITHEAGGEYTDEGAVWTDIVDGTGDVVATGEVNVQVPGSYVLSIILPMPLEMKRSR